MAKVTLTELENILKKIEDGVGIEEFKEKFIQVANGFRELTLAKQKDDQRNATALEALKKSSEKEILKQKEEFNLKTNKLKKEHAEEISKIQSEFESKIEESKEQVRKELSEQGPPSTEVLKALDEAETLIKTLAAKTPWLAGMATEFLNKIKAFKK